MAGFIIGQGGESDQQRISLATSKNRNIPNSRRPERAPEAMLAAREMWLKDNRELRSMSATYNCIGMVFANRRTWIDFASMYANNVRFEASVWDLKILFGELDQTEGAGKTFVELHTAITVSWPTAKIMAYFLAANCASHQAQTGPIHVPSYAVPPRPDPSNAVWAGMDKNLVNYLGWIHDQFFGANPYLPPDVEKKEAPTDGTAS